MHRFASGVALAVALALATVTGAPAHGAAPPPSTDSSLRLLAQTSWVTSRASGTTFDLRLEAHAPGPPASTELDVIVYRPLNSRSEFARSLTGPYRGYVVSHPVRTGLDVLDPGARGVIDLHIPVDTLHLGENAGVYPVEVELVARGTGTVLTQFVTHLVTVPPTISGPKLNVAWIVPVHAPPPDPATGTLTGAQLQQLSTVVTALATYPAVPVTVNAVPDTIAALEAADPATVGRLGRSLAGREVLATTWVPAEIPAELEAGLGSAVSLSLARGDDRLSADLGVDVAGRTWVEDGPMDPETLTFLRGSQFQRVVLPEADLGANPLTKTVEQPFKVAGSDQTLIGAGVADAGLAAHFTNQPDPVLAAHQLLADLTQVYEDAPSNTRGVIVVPPDAWVPTGAFLATVLQGLQSSPVLAPQTVDTVFDTVPPLLNRGTPVVRSLVTDDAAVRAAAGGLLPRQQAAARTQLDALANVLVGDTARYAHLEQLLLEVPSDDLNPAGRQAILAKLDAGLRGVTGLVQLPHAETITLTARKGHLPITVVSASDQPLSVVLRLESDKLVFDGGAVAVYSLPLHLHKGTNAVDITVEARTPGRTPLTISVWSPDGSYRIARTSFEIQSTVLSGAGVILTVGAALFLVIWWGRHAWRSRRTRRDPGRRRHAPGRAAAAREELVSATRGGT